MNKNFDSVGFQRKRRRELSKRIAGKSAAQISTFFNSKSKRRSKTRAA